MAFKQLTFDALKKPNKFQSPKSAEAAFMRALKMVAKAASGIISPHVHETTVHNQPAMMEALKRYSEALGPWAERQSRKLIDSVNKRNQSAIKMKNNSQAMATALQNTVANGEIGRVAQALINDQVKLIKSIPLEAGLRVQKLALESVYSGGRALVTPELIEDIKQRLGSTEEFAINRAKLIAVTETARANAAISQARATAVGSSKYIWRNSGDGAVRDAHRKWHGKNLDGQIFYWNDPPTLDDGTKGNPGTFPRCRCFAEAVFDD